jgi:hypothetical protein
MRTRTRRLPQKLRKGQSCVMVVFQNFKRISKSFKMKRSKSKGEQKDGTMMSLRSQ